MTFRNPENLTSAKVISSGLSSLLMLGKISAEGFLDFKLNKEGPLERSERPKKFCGKMGLLA